MEEKLNRILIVDDNKDIHEDIKCILNSFVPALEYNETELLKKELFGDDDKKSENEPSPIHISYNIDDAYQGEEAVKMVKQALKEGYPYSLIFMDVRMPPGIDGIQAITEIWKIDPNVEVVICTAYSDYSWDQIIMKLGQNNQLLFIRKPFDNISVKQIALSLTTKWNSQKLNRVYIENLESEVAKRTIELKTLVEKMSEEIKLRKEKEEQLAYNANHDSLTGLLNRYSFYFSIEEAIRTAENHSFSLFFIDMDGFKEVNDVLGHDIGDLLLKEISGRINDTLSSYTIKIRHSNDKSCLPNAIFRLGGDEFTAIISTGEKEKIEEIARRLVDNVRRPYIIQNQKLHISCSIGISLYPEDSIYADTLLKCADIAMYRAKKEKNCFIFFENEENKQYFNKLTLENDLDEALDKNQIKVYYQTLVDKDGNTLGIEALARWLHPEYGLLKPEEFIPSAEKSDNIIKIGEYILRTACGDIKKLHEKGFTKYFVMVNCSNKQFYDPDFISFVKSILNEFTLKPGFLKLGLEDKFSFQPSRISLPLITELNKAGLQVVIDGLKNIYPTFGFLKNIPEQTIIKLNRIYIDHKQSDQREDSLLADIIETIQRWNLKAIISGIEKPEQSIALSTKDCILQGFHYNIPKPFNELVKEFT